MMRWVDTDREPAHFSAACAVFVVFFVVYYSDLHAVVTYIEAGPVHSLISAGLRRNSDIQDNMYRHYSGGATGHTE